jgi:hypothetical protein
LSVSQPVISQETLGLPLAYIIPSDLTRASHLGDKAGNTRTKTTSRLAVSSLSWYSNISNLKRRVSYKEQRAKHMKSVHL